ncbi:hypothetical protein B0J13DRAFT_551381 [Dactylonectria estremocensis]|uniref:Secreted protein n=1 Tax=Dactylonectria estremocensis TaxID=1079267 RepID=A0A9P9J5X5_9HYPO|nr:hypothetical protein B0J13DRAFT_551381 [Dactylonectria estremocensis]
MHSCNVDALPSKHLHIIVTTLLLLLLQLHDLVCPTCKASAPDDRNKKERRRQGQYPAWPRPCWAGRLNGGGGEGTRLGWDRGSSVKSTLDGSWLAVIPFPKKVPFTSTMEHWVGRWGPDFYRRREKDAGSWMRTWMMGRGTRTWGLLAGSGGGKRGITETWDKKDLQDPGLEPKTGLGP